LVLLAIDKHDGARGGFYRLGFVWWVRELLRNFASEANRRVAWPIK
jgi:hypothetical protein